MKYIVRINGIETYSHCKCAKEIHRYTGRNDKKLSKHFDLFSGENIVRPSGVMFWVTCQVKSANGRSSAVIGYGGDIVSMIEMVSRFGVNQSPRIFMESVTPTGRHIFEHNRPNDFIVDLVCDFEAIK